MPSFTIDIDWDEIESCDLIAEVKRRIKHETSRQSLSEAQKKEIRDALKPLLQAIGQQSGYPRLHKKTLEDELKEDVVYSVWDRYTAAQFEAKLKP